MSSEDFPALDGGSLTWADGECPPCPDQQLLNKEPLQSQEKWLTRPERGNMEDTAWLQSYLGQDPWDEGDWGEDRLQKT